MTALWVSYWSGAALSLALKYSRYLYHGTRDKRRNWKTVTLEYLFQDSQANKVSWATTIGVVWVGGALFVNGGQQLLLGDWFPLDLTHASSAFLAGVLMEMTAPNLAKVAVAKFAPKFLRGKEEE